MGKIFYDAQIAGVVGGESLIRHLNEVAGWIASPPIVGGRYIMAARVIPRAAMEVIAGAPLRHRQEVEIAGETIQAIELPSTNAVIAALETHDVRAWRHRAWSRRPWTRERVRRACWKLRHVTAPSRTYFAKGTVSVSTPADAVALLGGTEWERITFLNKFGEPIASYHAVSDGPRTWAVPDEIGMRFPHWEAFSPLGRSAVSAIFGVHG